MKTLLCALILSTAPAPFVHGSPSKPRKPPAPEAAAVIAKVAAAADKQDGAALRVLMVKEFRHDPGGVYDADEALALWKKNPAAFVTLKKTLARCHEYVPDEVWCAGPQQHEAIFRKTPDGWRMIQFSQEH